MNIIRNDLKQKYLTETVFLSHQINYSQPKPQMSLKFSHCILIHIEVKVQKSTVQYRIIQPRQNSNIQSQL